MRRVFARPVFAAAAACLLVVVVMVVPAGATGAKRWDRHRVNHVRAAHGVTGVHRQWRVQRRAQRWADRVASTGRLADDSAGYRACWRVGGHVYGSNVGYGPGVRAVEYAFERSPVHRANILGRGYRLLGVGVARGHGRVWLVQEFCG